MRIGTEHKSQSSIRNTTIIVKSRNGVCVECCHVFSPAVVCPRCAWQGSVVYVHKDINTTHAVPFEKTRKITIAVQNSHAKER